MRFNSWPAEKPYSFSALTSFEECPAMFAMTYLADPKIEENNNAFAEYGTLCHDLFDKYAKGELCDFELASEYESRYPDEVVHNFPPYPKNYAEKVYNLGLQYFQEFEGFGDQYEIVASEQMFETTICGHKFKGIIDLILRNTVDDTIVIVDHKSKSASGMKKDFSTYVKQLYLYSVYVKETYGKYPSLLRFNVFKENKFFDEVFSEKKLQEVIQWMDDIVMRIEMEDEWEATPPGEYFCRWICGYSTLCPSSPIADFDKIEALSQD